MGKHPNNAIIITTVKGEAGLQGFQAPAGPIGATGPVGPQGPTGPADYGKIDVCFTENKYPGVKFDSNDGVKQIGKVTFPGTIVAPNVSSVQIVANGRHAQIAAELVDTNGNVIASTVTSVSSTMDIYSLDIVGTFPTTASVLTLKAKSKPFGLSSGGATTDTAPVMITFLEIK
jgi:hypothetical protein